MKSILSYCINSTWFKKYSGMVGAFCLGLWFQQTYWKQINITLSTWGISPGEWATTLWTIIGATGICASIGLSLAKSSQDAAADKASTTNPQEIQK